jgi:hypothetical protein
MNEKQIKCRKGIRFFLNNKASSHEETFHFQTGLSLSHNPCVVKEHKKNKL